MVDWSRSLDAAGCSRQFEVSAKSPLTIGESMVDCQRSLNFAGWRRGQSRHAHNVKIGGSNPSPAKFPLDNRRKHDRLSMFFQ